ncbi:MAG: hypothetical protein GY701_23385 [Sulfitobacter sp.]|nr:hypothetical protein [Sulfitobacter sp.]
MERHAAKRGAARYGKQLCRSGSTYAQVASHLGVSPSTLRRWRDLRTLRSIRIEPDRFDPIEVRLTLDAPDETAPRNFDLLLSNITSTGTTAHLLKSSLVSLAADSPAGIVVALGFPVSGRGDHLDLDREGLKIARSLQPTHRARSHHRANPDQLQDLALRGSAGR